MNTDLQLLRDIRSQDFLSDDMRARIDERLRAAEAPEGASRGALGVDPEALIQACLPGGHSCDPQQVADAIRAFLAKAAHAQHGAQEQSDGSESQAPQGFTRAGEAGTMPGTDGFTMACFQAGLVPVGTPLYIPADLTVASPGGQPVAMFDELKGRPVLLQSAPLLKHGQLLYTDGR